MCPSLPPPLLAEMVTSAVVSCVVSLLMLSSVGCNPILAISNAWRALNMSYRIPMIACFVHLPLVQISLQLLDSGKRINVRK